MISFLYIKHAITLLSVAKLNYSYYYTCLTAYISRITCVSQYQKGKTSLDLNEARVDGIEMQV